MVQSYKSILIVEDDQDIRQALRDILVSEGYSVLEAENGRAALDMLKKNHAAEPCLILLDLLMPEMNGWEFLEIRRKTDCIKAIPTVVVSAVTAGSKQPTHATRVLKKPINLIELIDAVEEHCDRIQ